jgi:hypothetical protein
MGAKGLALRLLHQVAKETRFRDWDIEPEKSTIINFHCVIKLGTGNNLTIVHLSTRCNVYISQGL